MYSTEWCGVCKKARNYFTANDIPFKEYDVEKSTKGARDYKKLNARGVPVILVGKSRLNGFSSGKFENLYESAN
ncbi:MAG: glutaredoxin domain-containing protein [Gammaproteobacteria bacterium]